MRQATAWFIYLGVVMVGGALAAPWCYWAVQSAAEHWSPLRSLAELPFHLYVNRAMLAVALLGIFPLVRVLGLRRWRDVGLPPPRQNLRSIRAGFFLGFCSMFALGAFLMLVGARGPDVRHPWLVEIWRIFQILLTAVTVGFLEELLFRGTLFGTLRRAMPWRIALVLSSLIYALLHFLQKPVPPPSMTWITGLQVLGQMLPGLSLPPRLGAQLACLILAGLLLGLSYQRTGTLYFSIGLHAAWIFFARTFNRLTDGEATNYAWLWGTGRLYDGWMTSFVLAVMLIWMWHFRRWPKHEPEIV